MSNPIETYGKSGHTGFKLQLCKEYLKQTCLRPTNKLHPVGVVCLASHGLHSFVGWEVLTKDQWLLEICYRLRDYPQRPIYRLCTHLVGTHELCHIMHVITNAICSLQVYHMWIQCKGKEACTLLLPPLYFCCMGWLTKFMGDHSMVTQSIDHFGGGGGILRNDEGNASILGQRPLSD